MALLTVNNLSKNYGKVSAVKNVSFSFQPGKCVALIGPNGAGKTTILRTLAGLLKPSTGMIQFEHGGENNDIRSHIGYLPQYPSFFPWMTGKEFLVFSGKLAHLSTSQAKKRAEMLLQETGIYAAKNKRIQTYSGGMKQRLGIAQAIIHRPKLLLLDEPVSSLDPMGRRDVLTLMETLKEELTILFSTHILTDAEEISDELLLLHHGEIVEAGPLNQLREKYQTTTLTLNFATDIEAYEEKVQHLASVRNTAIRRDTLYITVTDIAEAREQILSLAVQEQWPLTNFSVNRASLEDMFMKVVD